MYYYFGSPHFPHVPNLVQMSESYTVPLKSTLPVTSRFLSDMNCIAWNVISVLRHEENDKKNTLSHDWQADIGLGNDNYTVHAIYRLVSYL